MAKKPSDQTPPDDGLFSPSDPGDINSPTPDLTLGGGDFSNAGRDADIISPEADLNAAGIDALLGSAGPDASGNDPEVAPADAGELDGNVSPAGSTNAEIRRKMVERRVLLSKFQNRTIRRLFAVYESIKEEMQEAAESGLNGWALDKVRDALHEIGHRLTEFTEKAEEELDKELTEVGEWAEEEIFGAVESSVPEDAREFIKFARLPDSDIIAAFRPRAASSLAKLRQDQLAAVQVSVASSQAFGEGPKAAAKRLMFHVDTITFPRAQTIVRTETAHIAHSVQSKWMDRDSHYLDGVQWTATLDNRTCPICGPRDGKVYPSSSAAPKIPSHPNCRCVLVPMAKGLDDLFPQLANHPTRGAISASSRASMNGQVPDTMTWADWLEAQDEKDPDSVRATLGAKRYDRWKAGTWKAESFSDFGCASPLIRNPVLRIERPSLWLPRRGREAARSRLRQAHLAIIMQAQAKASIRKQKKWRPTLAG